MEYMLIFTEEDDAFVARTDERAPEYWAEWSAYLAELGASGVVTYGAGLEPPRPPLPCGCATAARPGRPLRRVEGAPGRLLRDRRARPRRRARVGG